MRSRRRVLLIGLDAAEPDLIERWTKDGSLRNLSQLQAYGTYTRLANPDSVLLGPPWPSFYSSKPVSEHGLYEYLVWRPDLMDEARASEVCRLEPFWRRFGENNPRSVVIDVPLVPAPQPMHGVEVCCYGTHERLVPYATQPPNLAQDLTKSIGRSPLRTELHHPVSLGRLLRERDMLVDTTRYVTKVAERLLLQEEWDLGIVCFSACHRAGHKLWSPTGSNGKGTAAEKREFRDALLDVYREVDAALGRVIDAAGPNTDVLAFSLHGMGPNSSLVTILPELLDRILADHQFEPGANALSRLRLAVPLSARSWVKRRLPVRIQDRLSTFWRTRRNWSHTTAISLEADIHGFIRINLAGREAKGVVPPEDYAAVCKFITQGLLSFRDAKTGAPVVSTVLYRTDLYEAGTYAERLPDLIVVWSSQPVSELTAVVSDQYGTVAWPTPGRNPDGRSGNHRAQGWLAAAGPSIRAGQQIRGASILDIAPTALSLLGLEKPEDMVGASLLEMDQKTTERFGAL